MRDLRDTEVPGAEDARRRAWAVTSEAFANAQAENRSLRKTPGRFLRVVEGSAAVLVVAGVGLVALTPTGSAVADWVARVVEPAPDPDPPPVAAPSVEHRDRGLTVASGRVRLRGRALGRWDGAALSPHARYVVAWRGRRLAALAPDGRTVWRIAAPAAVRGAAWSPEGFHVAYLAGRDLRVVAGNGLRDRAFRGPVHAVAPVFRPGARRSLTWVRLDGRVELRDVFTGQRRAISGPRLGLGARELTWTPGGRRLVVRTADGVRVWQPPR